MQRNVTRLLPWLVVSVILALAALFAQSLAPGNIVAVSLYKAHLLSLGGWIGYWLDRALFPYDRPHEYLLPELEEVVGTLLPGTEVVAEPYEFGELVDGRNYGTAMIRRAIIVAAALICVGLGSQVVGFLDSATLEGLASVAPSLGLQSTAVSVLDDQARRFAVPPASGGGSWPANWVDDLPGALRNYRAVLWDANAGRLVVIPQGTIPGPEGRLPQLTLLPNVATKQGATVSVVRADTVAAEQLRNAGGLVLLAGKL